MFRQLLEAVSFAARAHHGQMRKDHATPYVSHSFRVCLIVRDLFKILGKINREDKVTILVVEQNAQLALELADQAYVIETGRIVMSGNAKDIANNEDVRKSYLGY